MNIHNNAKLTPGGRERMVRAMLGGCTPEAAARDAGETKMNSLDDVRAASAAFYAALNSMANGNAAPMAEVWGAGEQASAQHPIGGRDVGRDAIVASFANVAKIAGGGDIRLEDQLILAGSDMAVETGCEVGMLTIADHRAVLDHRVTNVYRLENGRWKMQHHHTDPSPALLDILKLLKAAS